MNRGLRAATTGLLLLVPLTLGACSAGQVNQTSTQNRDKVGVSAELGPDVEVHALNVLDPARTAAGSDATAYTAGDDAELTFVLTNDRQTPVELTDVSAEGFAGAFSTAVTGTLPDDDGSGVDIRVAAGSAVRVGFRPSPTTGISASSDDRRVFLTGLRSAAAPLTPGELVPVTFTVDGEDPVTVVVAVNGPKTRAEPSAEADSEAEAETSEE